MAGLMAGDRGTAGKPVLQDVTSIPEKEVPESRKKQPDASKPSSSHLGQPSLHKDNTQYYFHPRVNLSHFGPEEGGVAVPLEGQLVPMAIPLGKPKTDPALRPPIATHDEQSTPQIEGNSSVMYICFFCALLCLGFWLSLTYKQVNCMVIRAQLFEAWLCCLLVSVNFDSSLNYYSTRSTGTCSVLFNIDFLLSAYVVNQDSF